MKRWCRCVWLVKSRYLRFVRRSILHTTLFQVSCVLRHHILSRCQAFRRNCYLGNTVSILLKGRWLPIQCLCAQLGSRVLGYIQHVNKNQYNWWIDPCLQAEDQPAQMTHETQTSIKGRHFSSGTPFECLLPQAARTRMAGNIKRAQVLRQNMRMR